MPFSLISSILNNKKYKRVELLPPDISNASYSYSMRAINSLYTGPVVNIRSSDGSFSDFYTDNKQSYLTTGPGGSGTTYQNWIGVNIGYVRILYDQSGSGNDASNNSNDITQPKIYKYNNYFVLNFTGSNNTVLYINNSIQPLSIYYHFAIRSQNTFTTIVSSQNNFSIRIIGSDMRGFYEAAEDWLWNAEVYGSWLSYSNNVFDTVLQQNYLQYNKWYLVTISSTNINWNPNNVYPTESRFYRIGLSPTSTNYNLTGYMSEIIFYNNRTNSTDMLNYYNSRFF